MSIDVDMVSPFWYNLGQVLQNVTRVVSVADSGKFTSSN